ncbi:MAG: RNA-binding protein [Firmicutes bacterium]|jgi:RNA recognition motif-containing protein|nr:RNA-binding protein [Bacillota bacterium]
MTKTLYVGNLPFDCNDQDLAAAFGAVTEVFGARVVTDRETGRSRGFGFVEVPADRAEAVATSLNGAEIGGRRIVVNEARERNDRPRSRR